MRDEKKIIVFDCSKNELFNINDNLKTLQRKLKSSFTIVTNNNTITAEVLQKVTVFVLAGPRALFTEDEFNVIRDYLNNGGSLLVMFTEGGEAKLKTNVNFLLEEFSIMVNNDAVIRTHYYKYFHPKECLISGGILNKGITQYLLQNGRITENSENLLTFVYPYGATLNVVKPAVPILSSGTVAFPLNRPICALYSSPPAETGTVGNQAKIAVLGSGYLLSDKYVHCEENDLIREILFTFLTKNVIQLNVTDAEDPEISDYFMVPEISVVSERVRSCLQEPIVHDSRTISDYVRLFDHKLYSFNMKCVTKILKAYDTLSVKHEPLRLIPPQFSSPLPPLQPAVFPPQFRDVQIPAFELFDLEETLGSKQMRLAQLTNKCVSMISSGPNREETEADIEYYIKEVNAILNVTNADSSNTAAVDCATILHNVMMSIVGFKGTAS